MRNFWSVFFGALAVLFILALLLGSSINMDKPARICEPYIVASGETLWDISDKYARGDKRAWIYEVCSINDIECSQIYAGDIIYVFKEGE